MQRHQRQHRAAAADAALLLIHDALIQIRAMAYSRQTVAAPEATDGDYHERIRMIADVCENLPGYLRTGTDASSAQGLQSAWDNADETQRAWLRDTLTQHGIDIAGAGSNLSRTGRAEALLGPYPADQQRAHPTVWSDN